jgi:GT2 family glycosyltransferase
VGQTVDTGPRPGAGERVAVVIASRDRPALLERALGNLRTALRPGDQAIVVDSASRDAETQKTAEAAGFCVVRCDRPGLSRARNLGVRVTSAPFVAFTDDDCEVDKGWAAAVAAALVPPDIGFVTGQVRHDGAQGMAVSLLEDAEPALFRIGDDLTRLGHGANMAWRRAVLEDIGGFDETLGAGAPLRAAEDQDAFWRALQTGCLGRYDPRSIVTHLTWRGRGAALLTSYGYGCGSGALAAKMARSTEAGMAPLREALWDDGLARALEHLRAGYEGGAAAEMVKTLGVAVGIGRAWRRPLHDGRFA